MLVETVENIETAEGQAAKPANRKRVVNVWADGTPRCASSKAYAEWLAVARKFGSPVAFCTDCTSEYQAKMRARGLCERPYLNLAELADD